ncbi:hypothetical protein AB7G19_16230 [Bradyrhizobium sp. 215_C5_N1_1]|uniref:hypothetical protein n=1 Tax=unclassified Bradyrhizobium TaxID=2631580 RepID=UPI003F8C8D5C
MTDRILSLTVAEIEAMLRIDHGGPPDQTYPAKKKRTRVRKIAVKDDRNDDTARPDVVGQKSGSWIST